MSQLSPSELVLNPDGSIYHLHLFPEQIADTILTVGDPDRVPLVSRHFDEVEVKVKKREFVTHTGRLGDKRLTVISTGIGTDNIDIVLNELDALANIDLQSREIRAEKKQLSLIRVGTTGGLQPKDSVGTLVSSEMTIGLDNLLQYYPYEAATRSHQLAQAFTENFPGLPSPIYAAAADAQLLDQVTADWLRGITLTAPGFYAPQGRSLRLVSRFTPERLDAFTRFRFEDLCITNLEMETSALFALAKMLGHRAISCSVILANRADGTFSRNAEGDVDRLIKTVLDALIML